MKSGVNDPVLAQRRYYTETASRYDAMHAHEAVDDDAGMQRLFSVLRTLDVRSLLDVGSATGRGLPKLSQGLPDALICGVEPVEALVRQGISSGGKQRFALFLARGHAPPFVDKSFHANWEFCNLHARPDTGRVNRG